jgi:L-aspartate oxidase
MDTFTTDVVVIGSGIAGLTTALKLANRGQRQVTVISKSLLGRGGSSRWAQGGVAVALDPEDSPALHASDTITVGVGLNDANSVRVLTEDGPARVLELVDLGVAFDRDPDGELAMGREAAHCRRRVVHAADATGAEIMSVLTAEVLRHPEIRIFEETFVVDLVQQNGRVVGLTAIHPGGKAAFHRADAVVLASGGSGQLYSRTTNPGECTADGLAIAARAGARLRDLELVQFHPTALDRGGDPMPLLTEALRGEGAKLIDENGERFMLAVHKDAELAPRDVVARGLWKHRLDGHQTLLDATRIGQDFPTHFPTVYEICRSRGLDPISEAIPVQPAAHYHMGGVEVDEAGRTSIAGLWACGEVASSGVHGANRLASNSLLEGLVFGARVADAILASPQPRAVAVTVPMLADGLEWRWRATDSILIGGLRDLMWREVGLARNHNGMRAALKQIARYAERLETLVGEAANMLLVARLLTTAALARLESRGAHYRTDYPETREEQRRHTVLLNGALLQEEIRDLGQVS